MDAQLPTVVLFQVATADGRVALSPGVLLMGDARWPRYDDGGYAGVLSRHQPHALLEGSGTLVLPDAGPLDAREARRASHGLQAPEPADPGAHFLPGDVLARASRWFAVVDSRGRVAWQFTEFPHPEWAGTHLLVLASRATPAHYLAFLRARRIPYLVAGDDRVEVARALAAMRAVLGVRVVVATCGALLGGALLREGLIDEVEIEVLPILAGGQRTPMMVTCRDLAPEEMPAALRLLDTHVYGDGRLLLRYAVDHAGHNPQA